jgi:signal peptidase II
VTAVAGRTSRRTTTIVLGTAAAVLVLDQLTKAWAQRALADGPIHVVWTLDFRLVINTGAAFSRGQGMGWLIGLLALGVVLVLLRYRDRLPSTLAAVALGAVLGGALGNLADRLFRGDGWLHGGVIDFIDFNWWPVFNVADIAVTLGVIGLLVTMAAGGGPASGAAGGGPASGAAGDGPASGAAGGGPAGGAAGGAA